MLTQHYSLILHLHVTCVILSGALFSARGIMRMWAVPLANHRMLRVSSYLIDTTLLTAAILLTSIIRQYPLTSGWLTVKVALLLVYIALGSLALKRAQTPRARLLAFLGALAIYAYIISVALAHDPLGVFRRFVSA
ncbi:SirB2 family protein [Nevskia soli]|uniref:SirB2 family protein n=1 Tax=Nevskia soli TaxID=418856 RepID=UPI0004A6ACCC|nr:SirB2 family protein [Nevskia soli]